MHFTRALLTALISLSVFSSTDVSTPRSFRSDGPATVICAPVSAIMSVLSGFPSGNHRTATCIDGSGGTLVAATVTAPDVLMGLA